MNGRTGHDMSIKQITWVSMATTERVSGHSKLPHIFTITSEREGGEGAKALMTLKQTACFYTAGKQNM